MQKDRLQVQTRHEEVAKSKEALENERNFLLDALQSKWMTDLQEQNQQDRLQLNIGGQLFETTIATLRNDPNSVLAKLSDNYEDYMDKHGEIFFDRDWWIFRYVLQYLREGNASLPHNKDVLKQLYKEAGFWKLRTMRRDIQNLYRRLSEEEAVAESDLWHQSQGLAPISTNKDTERSPEYMAAGMLPSTLRSTSSLRQPSPIQTEHSERHPKPFGTKTNIQDRRKLPPRYQGSDRHQKQGETRDEFESYFDSLSSKRGKDDHTPNDSSGQGTENRHGLKNKMKMVDYQPPQPEG